MKNEYTFKRLATTAQLMLSGLLMAACLLASSTELAAQPSNNECSQALPLVVSPAGGACNYVRVVTTGATQSSPNPTCTTTRNNDDVWYAFTATSTGLVISYQNLVATLGTATSVGYSITDGCSGTQIVCLANFGAGTSASETMVLDQALVIGNTYILRTWTGGGTVTSPNSGEYDLCLQPYTLAPPANDDCAGAIPVVLGNGVCGPTVTGTNVDATYSGVNRLECSASFTFYRGDVWYKFVPNSLTVNFQLLSLPASGTMYLEVYKGTCANSALTYCNNALSTATPEVIGGLTPGLTHYIRIYENGNNQLGTFSFCMTAPATAPTNDNCPGAIALFDAVGQPTGANGATFTTSNATASNSGGCTAGTPDDDVWFGVSAEPGNTLTVTVTGDATFDGVLGVFTGACGGLSTVACTNASADGGTEVYSFTTSFTGSGTGPSTVPTAYFIQVYDLSAGANSGSSFTITATLAAPLPVELTSFTARAEGSRNVMEWTAATEQDLGMYYVERAEAATPDAFRTVSELAPRGTNGVEAVYTAYDNSPSRVSYYRLRAVDLDGSVDYSDVVAVTRTSGSGAGVKVYPNPSHTGVAYASVELSNMAGEIDLTLTDAAGRQVGRMSVSADGRYDLPIGGLAAGMYTISAVSAESVVTERLMID